VIREDRKTNRVKIKQCFVGNRVIQGDLAKLDEQVRVFGYYVIDGKNLCK
jgi:hypothetical protein